MKLTKEILKKLIKEELSSFLGEQEMSGDEKIELALAAFAKSPDFVGGMGATDGVMPRGNITDDEIAAWNENNPQQLRMNPNDEDELIVSS